MTRSASRQVDVALGVECAWPLVRAEEGASAPNARMRARFGRRWRRLAVALLASVVLVSVVGLVVGSSDLATVLPSAVPFHSE